MSMQQPSQTNYKLKKILTVAVTAINIINTMTPLALPYTELAKESAASFNIKPNEAPSVVYQVITNGGHIVDNFFFTKAEAYTSHVSNTTVSGEFLDFGDKQSIYSGGVANSTTIYDGGSQIIYNGGIANNTTAREYSYQIISNGGTANSTTLYNSEQIIYNGGTANNTTVKNISYQYISNGGVANNTTIAPDSWQEVSSGGIANNTIVYGSQTIYHGGVANNVTLLNGGTLFIDNYEVVVNNIIQSSGGNIIAYPNSSTIINGSNVNGSFYMSNGVANNFILYSAGSIYTGHKNIFNNTILNGGSMYVTNQTIANNTIINKGGFMDLDYGGTAYYATINSGAMQAVQANSFAGNTIINSGGSQVVLYSSGIASNTIVNSGGVQDIAESAVANNTIINGGKQYVGDFNPIANDTLIKNSGSQYVYSTGIANKTTIDDGVQIVSVGGTVNDTLINNDGIQHIYSTGIANKTTINGGVQLIYSGGTASINTLTSGGRQIVASGGSSVDTTVNTGGSMTLAKGAVVIGTLTNSGTLDTTTFVSNINALAGSNGLVLFSNPATTSYNKTLNIVNLSGSQTFETNVDLKNNTADKVVVNNASGTHYIKVSKENSPTSLLRTLQGAATVVEVLGTDTSTIQSVQSGIEGVSIKPQIAHNGNLWQITGYQVSASELAHLASSVANIEYSVLFITDNNMKRRLGELRNNLNNSGIWLRTYGGKAGLDQHNFSYTSIQGGYDKVHKLQNGNTLTGVTIEYTKGNTNYGSLGNGKLANTRLGIYHAWLGNSGHYYDLVLRTGRMSNSFTAYTDGEKNHASYGTWNTVVSAEYGYKKQLKYGYYIAPQVELSIGHLNRATYNNSNNTPIKQDAINSIIGRLGLTAGRKLDKYAYYLAGSIIHELAARSKTTTGTGIFTSTLERDLKATYFEFAVGGSVQTGNNGQIYLEAMKNFGGKINHKWQLQTGYRLAF